MAETLTPMMKQFYELKAKNPDAILLFRCGDFYETYDNDAQTASKVLGITLTRRNNKGQAASTEMAGFPYHALDTYLPRLIRAGYRVAICDQLEDPKLAKKLVKRGITELVTPGVAMADNVLNARENNFLAAVHFGAQAVGISLLDISTGEFLVAEGTTEYIDKLLAGFAPKEVLVQHGLKGRFEGLYGQKYFVFDLDDWAFTTQTANEKLTRHFQVRNLKGFGVDHLKDGVVAAGAIMCYLEITQHKHTSHITTLRRIEEDGYVRLDRFTTRNLELVAPARHSCAEARHTAARRYRPHPHPHGRPHAATLAGVPTTLGAGHRGAAGRCGALLQAPRLSRAVRDGTAQNRRHGAHSEQGGSGTRQSA